MAVFDSKGNDEGFLSLQLVVAVSFVGLESTRCTTCVVFVSFNKKLTYNIYYLLSKTIVYTYK